MATGKNKPQSGFFILKHIGLFAGMALLILVIDVFLYIAIALFEGQISYADGPDSANSEALIDIAEVAHSLVPVSYTHLRAHETRHDLVCRLLLEKNKQIV